MMGLTDCSYELVELCEQLRKEITNSGTGEFARPKAEYPAVLVDAHAKATALLEVLESDAFEEVLP